MSFKRPSSSKRRLQFVPSHPYATRSQKRQKLNSENDFQPYDQLDNAVGNSYDVIDASFDQMVPGFSDCGVDNSLYFDPDYCCDFYTNTQVDKKVPKKQVVRQIVCNTKGAFYLVPNEIFHKILFYLDHTSLGALALSSTELCVAVRSYIYTPRGTGQILPREPKSDDDEIDPEEFRGLGKLVQQLTVLQPLRTRLKTASFFLKKLEPIHVAISEVFGTDKAYECFGQMFTSFVSNWEDYEKMKAYGIVKTTSKLEDRVNKVLCSIPGSLPWHEKDIRLLHRNIFLLPSSSNHEEYVFWLTQILKPWPITFQAKLLFILTGPQNDNGFLCWSDMCGCTSNHVFSRGQPDLTELGHSLRVMYTHGGKNWSEGDVGSIIDELSITPSGWCLQNVACLLIKCGTAIAKDVLRSRAISGHVNELVVLSYYLASAVSETDTDDESWDISSFVEVLKDCMDNLPNSINKTDFLSSLMDKWRDYLAALFKDYGDEGIGDYDEVEVEFQSALDSLRKFTLSLLQMNVEKIPH